MDETWRSRYDRQDSDLIIEPSAIEYAEYRPPGRLSARVERFWKVRTSRYPYQREMILPDGAVELMITLGPVHGVVDPDTGSVSEYASAWIAGQRSRPITVEAKEGYDLIGVRFRPGGAFPYVDAFQTELTDQVIDLGVLWGPASVRELQGRLARERGAAAQFATLEDVLTARRLRVSEPPAFLEAAVSVLCQEGSAVSVGSLARRYRISHRRLIRAFERYVGVKPKMLQRILRFQRVIALEADRPALPWNAVAQRCGYFDQAHMIRDFQVFAGMTPERYRQCRAEFPNYVPA